MPISDPWLPTTGSTVPANRAATPIAVYRYEPEGAGLTLLPNVRALSVRQREGLSHAVAQFRYVFDGTTVGAPQSVEQALSTAFTGPLVVEVNDRLAVYATRPDGFQDCLFDGFALGFGMALDRKREMVVVTAISVSKRTDDTPVGGMTLRDGNHASDPSDDYLVDTDLMAQFNPRGVPNATPEGTDSGEAGAAYPAFLDPNIVRSPDVRRSWDLAMVARYLMLNDNADEAFVLNMDPAETDALLVSKEPDGISDFDPTDPSTYRAEPILAADTPITGQSWPRVLHGQLANFGFGAYWSTTADAAGNPRTELVVYDPRASTPKPLLLQARGSILDPAASNVGQCGLARELTDVANAWTVQGGLIRYEASFILSPGFPMASSDAASASAIAAFDRSDPSYSGANHDAYRLYVWDETGEGHYAVGTGTPLTTVPTTSGGAAHPVLDDLFGAGTYAVRRRRPLGELISVNGNNNPYHAKLHISRNYTGTPVPGLWDGTGTWQAIEGGWELAKDRLGIRITAVNPNAWKIAEPGSAISAFAGGVVKGVESMATSSSASFVLMLTCVIEADVCVKATANRRDGSPIAESITRLIDARDRLRRTVIAKNSWFNQTGTAVITPDNTRPSTAAVRDDTDAAQAEAEAVRAATDSGVLAGPVVIPRFTRYYGIGDRISAIEGRGLSLQTNNTAASDDAPVYPVVVDVLSHLDAPQSITLMLSDAAADRGQYRRAIGGR